MSSVSSSTSQASSIEMMVKLQQQQKVEGNISNQLIQSATNAGNQAASNPFGNVQYMA
jgi:hypothetical protein